MWLISTQTLCLQEFPAGKIPPYAILSHVWGEDEVTFSEMKTSTQARHSPGFLKIKHFCRRAALDNYRWVWIDTCCIDKTSSAALSEAINSMFQWYRESAICYAFLRDVRMENPGTQGSTFRRSAWFTRGWTLQELLAPREVVFVISGVERPGLWVTLGTRTSLGEIIEEVTGIDLQVLLQRVLLDDINVAQRMSWAAQRRTTRVEDRAYSLMGIFSVMMPVIYGEGLRAFTRLQLEILKHAPDHSIFCWGPIHDFETLINGGLQTQLTPGGTWLSDNRCLLASSPANFEQSQVRSDPLWFGSKWFKPSTNPEYYLTNYGIRIQLPILDIASDGATGPLSLAVLPCHHRGKVLSLLLSPRPSSKSAFYVGMYDSDMSRLADDGHPAYRVFAIPPIELERVAARAGTVLLVSDVYLHSHNQNHHRTRDQGLARLELLGYHFGHPPPLPLASFEFVLPGWAFERLSRSGYRFSDAYPEYRGVAGWLFSRGRLALSLPSRSNRHGVCTFRNPESGDMFAVCVGVVSPGILWAAVLFGPPGTNHEGPSVEGTNGSLGNGASEAHVDYYQPDGSYDGRTAISDCHDHLREAESIRDIWERYASLGAEAVARLRADSWYKGVKTFDHGARRIRLSILRSSPDSDERTTLYVVGIKIDHVFSLPASFIAGASAPRSSVRPGGPRGRHRDQAVQSVSPPGAPDTEDLPPPQATTRPDPRPPSPIPTPIVPPDCEDHTNPSSARVPGKRTRLTRFLHSLRIRSAYLSRVTGITEHTTK